MVLASRITGVSGRDAIMIYVPIVLIYIARAISTAVDLPVTRTTQRVDGLTVDACSN
jgi:hypothetical protein